MLRVKGGMSGKRLVRGVNKVVALIVGGSCYVDVSFYIRK